MSRFKNVFLIFFPPLLLFFFFNIPTGEAQDYITDLNPKNFNRDWSEYHQETAIYCAQLSDIAYLDATEIEPIIETVNKAYPHQKYIFQFIQDKGTGTELIFWGNQDFVVIAFRGTEFLKDIKDIIQDIKIKSYEQREGYEGYSNLPPGHAGFRNCIIGLMSHQDIFNQLRQFIKKCNIHNTPNFPIYTTGHSLGAALATLIIEPLNFEKFNFSGCYNFAPPLTISKTDNQMLKEKYGDKIYDISNHLDFIPRAGFLSRRNLGRIGKFYRICEEGEINSEPEKRNGKYISYRWKQKTKIYKFHKLSGYIEGVKAARNSNQLIKKRKAEGQLCF